MCSRFRYWAVTNVVYTRNSHRIGVMTVVIWSVALVVSLAPQIPQIGWKDPDYLHRINVKKQCLVSQDLGYQIFATSSTFYVPLLVIFVLYWKIFQTARKRIRKRREMRDQNVQKSEKTNNNSSSVSKNFLTKRRFLRMKRCTNKKSSAAEVLLSSLVMTEGQSTTTMDVVEEQEEPQNNGMQQQEETTAFTITKPRLQVVTLQNNAHIPPVSNNVSPEKSSTATTNNGSASHQSHISDISRVEILNREMPPCPASVDKLIPSRKDKKETLEAKRERKAAKTLAIITGAFVMCWLPFFILALVMPLCASCTINPYVMSFALWLGYFNSTLNPVIYTIFNPEFRQAFKRILCGVHGRGKNFRSGKIR